MKKLFVIVFLMFFLGFTGITLAYSIRDDASGGDYTQIGMWDYATKTCTLTTDVEGGITIDSDYITLDGNRHIITGSGYGVHLYLRTGVTLKNLYIRSSSGISIYSSHKNNILNNIITPTEV